MNLESASASLAILVLFSTATAAFAQHAGHQHGHGQAPAQAAHNAQGQLPYAGLQQREIKALSPEQIEGLRAGRGMSLALAAELNGFPGPMHVLELAAQLKLTPEQTTRTRELFGVMQKRAQELGEEVIAAERELEVLFQSRRITPALLDSQAQKIAQLQGRLRAVHLRKHLEMMQILTAEQVHAYNQLRGY